MKGTNFATLQELEELEHGERLTRLERRDLAREELVDQLASYAKLATRGVLVTAGGVLVLVAQELGLEIVPLLGALAGG